MYTDTGTPKWSLNIIFWFIFDRDEKCLQCIMQHLCSNTKDFLNITELKLRVSRKIKNLPVY